MCQLILCERAWIVYVDETRLELSARGVSLVADECFRPLYGEAAW